MKVQILRSEDRGKERGEIINECAGEESKGKGNQEIKQESSVCPCTLTGRRSSGNWMTRFKNKTPPKKQR